MKTQERGGGAARLAAAASRRGIRRIAAAARSRRHSHQRRRGITKAKPVLAAWLAKIGVLPRRHGSWRSAVCRQRKTAPGERWPAMPPGGPAAGAKRRRQPCTLAFPSWRRGGMRGAYGGMRRRSGTLRAAWLAQSGCDKAVKQAPAKNTSPANIG